MQCRQVKANLINYLAREYPLFDLEELEAHLSRCPTCREELAGLQEVDRALSRLPRQCAPPGFAAGIMDSIRSGTPPKLPVEKRRPAGRFAFIRDLAAAAAVTLALFWSGGTLFDGQNVSLAGRKMDIAVQAYVRTSGDAVTRAYHTVGSLSEQLLAKEWNHHEVRPSR